LTRRAVSDTLKIWFDLIEEEIVSIKAATAAKHAVERLYPLVLVGKNGITG
jgi:hypothetical protein